MANRYRNGLILVAVLGAASPALAAGADPLRCEARQLRCESDYFQCVSHCDRREARAAARADGALAAAPADTDCEDKCAERHGETMQRISRRPPCVDERTPDPATCEARLLRIAASHRVCQSRCLRRELVPEDATACLTRCVARCGASVDDTMVQMTCAEGRMSEAEVCAVP